MSSETIYSFKRKLGKSYRVDKQGNLIESDYSWFRDPYTIVAITIIILSLLYYLQISQMKTIEDNFEESCMVYMNLRYQWEAEHPGEEATFEKIFTLKGELNNRQDYNFNNIEDYNFLLNISNE